MKDRVPFLFLAVTVFLAFILWRWHKNPTNPVDLTDLLMENGRLSRLGVTWMGSFLVMTFGFVYLILKGTITDTYAALYSATWAAPIVAKLWTPKEPPKET